MNSVGSFRHQASDLLIADRNGLTLVEFDKKCPVGLKRGTPPTLDLVLEGAGQIIGIGPRCTEYLSPHTARFAPACQKQSLDARRESGWFGEMLRLSTRRATTDGSMLRIHNEPPYENRTVTEAAI